MPVLDSIKEYLPEISAKTMTNVGLFAIAFIICAGIVGIVIYFIYVYIKFDKKIIIFEKIGQHWEPTKEDKAMEYKIQESGDTLFLLKNHKKYLPSPRIQTGRKKYWYAIRSDGEWINIGIGDVDEQMKVMNVFFLDKDMRYARVAMQRLMEKRLQSAGFWEKYGGIIAYIALIFVTGLVMWLLAAKFVEVSAASKGAIEASKEVLEQTGRIVASLDALKGTGSITPAA